MLLNSSNMSGMIYLRFYLFQTFDKTLFKLLVVGLSCTNRAAIYSLSAQNSHIYLIINFPIDK